MQKKISLIILIHLILSLSVITNFAFGASTAVEYLCELGIAFYRQGRYDDALQEFKKALMLDSNNQTAQKYINEIFQKQGEPIQPSPAKITKAPEARVIKEKPVKRLTREEAIEQALQDLTKKETKEKLEEKIEKKRYEIGGVKISGETQVRLGMTSEDTIWKQANWDLNEKNWRILSDAALNKRENTYDTRTYDRLRINLDTQNEEGLGFHSAIIVDPWSFVGKADKITIISSGGVPAEFELKYCGNSRYTLQEIGYTLFNGDTFTIPEIKVIGGKTSAPVIINSNWSGTFTLPELKIHREFQPLRELWFDYKQEKLKLRFFPIAYENQALTFDDPLKLSNNHIWWEESPWLRRWKSGIYNSAQVPVDFTKGYWDNSLSFSIRDSEGSRLTQLRGFSFEFNPQEETSVITSLASPKDLWQDYSDVDNIISATRLKHKLIDNLAIGTTYTMRTGLNIDEGSKTDSRNHVIGTDLGYEIVDGLKASFEVARSQSDYDLTNSQYKTESRGNAYYFSLMGRYPRKSIMDLEYGYDEIQPEKNETAFTKFRLFGCHMDEKFDAPLSSYRETRKDEFWSRHLHFRKPFKYYYIGFYRDVVTWDDIKPYRIGNGIDVGRDVLGLRIESSFWDRELENLFDVRNVHNVNGKYIENVTRDEVTWQVNDKLVFKALGIYQDMPKTKGGIDPFVFNRQTGLNFTNNQIQDGKDCSLKTGSLGLEYAFFDWLALNGIWERTNDYYLGYDGFPRSILNSGSNSYTYWEEGNKYRQANDWLYSQTYFPNPPYPYYDIFKVGLRLIPIDKMEVYLDYTRNEYEKAGQNDDNMNHLGIEVSYLPTSKLALFLRYTYSRWQDLDRLTQGVTETAGHHNFFVEAMYRKSEDEDLVFQYGEAGRTPIMGEMFTIGWDPYGGSLRTIDTQHIFRLYYRRRF